MHEVSLGGLIADYLTGESRECTTYEDLRQALARYLVEEKGYAPSLLVPRYAVAYEAGEDSFEREADIAAFCSDKRLGLLLVFCPGQINTYVREVTAMARLALPHPAPLAVVTDMREALLFAVNDGGALARGLRSLPGPEELDALAPVHCVRPLDAVRREREGRILHTYTGLLKTCCNAVCSV